MTKPTRLILNKLLLASGILFTLCFLCCCITPYVTSSEFHFATYASILFPYFLIGYIVWIILAFFLYRKYAWIFLVLLLPGIKNARSVFSLHVPNEFSYKKAPQQLRLLSWNVNGLLYAMAYEPGFEKKQMEMMDFMRNSEADILCLQDYVEAPPGYGRANLAFIRDSLHYPYYYFSNDCDGYGTAIFSRLPIIDSGHIKYHGRRYPESLGFASIVFKKDTLKVFNTHLRSMYLHSDSLRMSNVGYFEFIKDDTAFLFHSDRLERMIYFDKQHVEQARQVKKELNKTHTPYIFCADLNSVPSSYVYHHIANGLNDAFLQQGSGLGGTYHRFTFSLRIDVVLLSPQLQATQYFSPRPDLSDHYPIITDIQLRK